MIREWGKKWGIPEAAMHDLEVRMGIAGHVVLNSALHQGGMPASEGRQQALVMLEASQKDIYLFRNNVGALIDERGVPVRYGLANQSKEMNSRLKSSDLIGIRKRVITEAMVGTVIGQFVAREMKHEGWHFNAKDKHEGAQLTFINLIAANGGDASFCTGPGTL
jgi:hypothetical protein